MSFVSSVLLLAAMASGVAVPIFFGHALATGEVRWYIAAAIALALSALLMLSTRAVASRRS